MPRPRTISAPDGAGTQLDQLHALLLRLAANREPLPSTGEMANLLWIGEPQRVGELLRQGERERLWTVIYDRSHLGEIVGWGDAWRLRRGTAQRLPKRRCLACRKPFEPEHRFNFLCCAGRASEAA